MEIRYSREMNHNYMIIEAPEEETGYAVQMLSANAIEGLLKFRVRQTEEAREYYYEITSRQPLRRVLENGPCRDKNSGRFCLVCWRF